MALKVAVEHDGKEYGGEVMRIRATRLGVEDHGIFTAYLDCEGAGTGIMVGGYGLDSYDETEERRVGTAFGLDHIAEVMRVVGTSTWEGVAGQSLIVLYKGTSFLGSRPVGIASPMGDRVLIFKDHAEAWRSREAGR